MKKKSLLSHKILLTAICLTCALSMSACGSNKKTNENKDPLTGEDMKQTEENTNENGSETAAGGNYGEFDTMIADENTNPNDIIGYINTNIVSAGVNDVERFFKGLLGFGENIRDIDFTGLEESRQYMPEDMIAFMDLMKLEADDPSMVMSDEENRRVINLTLSEMLERALLFEQHLEKYPDNATTDAAARLYEEIATHAISGGYDKTEGISHFYKGESNDVIEQESLPYYQQFAEANPDSNLGRIVAEYVTILQANDFKINDAMEDFYMGLHERLDVKKWADTAGNGEHTQTNGTDTSNENGAAADGNNTNGTTTNGTGANGTTTNGTTNNRPTTNENNTNNSNASNNAGATGADTVIEGTISR
ncbi:MAG: hypothetical protein J6D08_11380 [Lachnospiraceae bacterium]|nr:hypothetical protein [Lachnospiraceae bacterium]